VKKSKLTSMIFAIDFFIDSEAYYSKIILLAYVFYGQIMMYTLMFFFLFYKKLLINSIVN